MWEGAGAARQWKAPACGKYPKTAQRGGCGSVRAAAAEEDVGFARAGGGAGPERATRQRGAAARRLRRCGGGRGLHAMIGLAEALNPTNYRAGGDDGGWSQRGPLEERPRKYFPGLKNIGRMKTSGD